MSVKNKWGEEVIGTYTDLGKAIADDAMGSFTNVTNEMTWSLLRLPERDYERRIYGREYQLMAANRANQGFKTTPFDAATARALRDMLNEALGE